RPTRVIDSGTALHERRRPTVCLTVLTMSGSPRQIPSTSMTRQIRPRTPVFQTRIAATTMSNGTNSELPLKNGMIRSKNALLKVRLIKRNNATSSDWSQDIGGKLACPTRLKTELRGLPDWAIRQAGSSETTFGRKHGPCPQGIPLLGYGRTNADKLEGIRHRISQSHGDLFRVSGEINHQQNCAYETACSRLHFSFSFLCFRDQPAHERFVLSSLFCPVRQHPRTRAASPGCPICIARRQHQFLCRTSDRSRALVGC